MIHCGNCYIVCILTSYNVYILTSYNVCNRYTCDAEEEFMLVTENDKARVCDGKADCTNESDERNCSNRFECDDGLKSIRKSQVFTHFFILKLI